MSQSKTHKTLIITEKPSEARNMAAGIGERFASQQGYTESDNYVITWAFGHLFGLAEPAVYDAVYEKWEFQHLPIIPEQFKYVLNKDAAAQFKTIKALLQRKDIDRVIEAGDPGREGELITRIILMMAGNKKPLFRFWESEAMTAATVKRGIANVKSAAKYDGLFKAAQARQFADWLIGMNASRAMSIKFQDRCSVGRVQTPVLSLIVAKEKEIEGFKPRDYWNIEAEFTNGKGESYVGKYDASVISTTPSLRPAKNLDEEDEQQDEGNRFYNKAEADKLISAIQGQAAIVTEVKTQHKKESPPPLFSLTTLQIMANQMFGFSADETLKLAQELYETDKALSYPRTESEYLTENLAPEVPAILQKLAAITKFDISKCTIDAKNKRVFDDTKFTDHYALMPTGIIPPAGNERKMQLYKLVCERFIAAFYPDFIYSVTTAITEVNSVHFKTSGKTVIDAGWRAIHKGIPKNISMPALIEKEAVALNEATLKAAKTTPPLRYAESSLLSVMKNISRFVTDPEAKKILKETTGLGTTATRASIIEGLKKRYLTVEKGKFVPNETATKLISLMQGSKLADPAYTAYMEQQLESSPDAFMDEVRTYITEFVSWAKNLDITPKNKESKYKPICKCPCCDSEVVAYPKVFSCKCGFALWRNGLEKLGKPNITESEAMKLIRGETVTLQLKRGDRKYTAPCLMEKREKGYFVKVIFK